MKNITKQFLLLIVAIGFLTACNTSNSSSVDGKSDSKSAYRDVQKMDYPYTIDHPDYWEIGSQENTMIALKSLKAWENKNMDECMSYYADSIHLSFDGLDKKVSNDTLRSWITTPASILSHSIKMQDWESIISTDKTKEFVTLWYREYMETAKGKDSIDVVNDFEIKDGKIIGLDQYIKRLH